MYYTIKSGSIFLSMNHRENQPWRRDIIIGSTDGEWKTHLATSGQLPQSFILFGLQELKTMYLS